MLLAGRTKYIYQEKNILEKVVLKLKHHQNKHTCNSGYPKDWIIVNSSVKWKELHFTDINAISYRYVLEFRHS